MLAIRLAAAVLASILLMTVDHRLHHLENVRSALSVLVYPIHYIVDLPVASVRWLKVQLAERTVLLAENRRLRERQLLLQAGLQKLSALEVENMRLRELLESSFKVGERVLIAELLAVDLDPYNHEVLVNKGSEHSLYVGQPVLDAKGVMGQTVHVGPLSTTVVLITDPSHAIPVRVNRNGLRTIALGTGTINRLELPHIPNNADIREGDLLITSGLGGRFPPDYPVARVTLVQTDPGRPFATVMATPSAHLERSRELLLVWAEDRDTVSGLPMELDPDAVEAEVEPEAAVP